MRLLWIMLLVACVTACAPLTRVDDGQAVPHLVRVRHPGVHAEEPQTYILYEIKDKHGFPAKYTLMTDSVICPEKTCVVITVNMAWDALGHFQRYDLPPGEFLEKGVPANPSQARAAPAASWKGSRFTAADYRKLDAILRDEHSLLGQKQLGDLARPHNADLVDGITGATPASIRDAVVEGASLTCYNLWHWANGEVADLAKELTHRQCGEPMLLNFLSSDKPYVVLFALDHLRLHKLFGPSAVREVIGAMRGGDRDQIDLGLAYLREALPEPEAFYGGLAALIAASTGEGRTYLLDRLASERQLPGRFFAVLSAGLPSWKNYYEIHLFLRLAEKHGYCSPALVAQTAQLMETSDFFVARRAYGFLNSRKALDAQTAARLQAFRDKAAREGRSL